MVKKKHKHQLRFGEYKRKGKFNIDTKYLDVINLTDAEREYQESGKHYYRELLCDQTEPFLERIINKNGYIIDKKADQLYTDEQIEDLHRAINQLTKKQKAIVDLLLDGNSQTETAKILNCHFSNITATLHGSVNPKYPGIKQGGILKKLRKILINGEEEQHKINRTCKIQDCTAKYRANGYCNTHYYSEHYRPSKKTKERKLTKLR